MTSNGLPRSVALKLSTLKNAVKWSQLRPLLKFKSLSLMTLDYFLLNDIFQKKKMIYSPVGKYDFNFLAPCPASGIILNADKDSLIEVDLIKDVVKRLNQQKTINVKQEVIKSNDHFFTSIESKVIEKVKNYFLKNSKN